MDREELERTRRNLNLASDIFTLLEQIRWMIAIVILMLITILWRM